MQERNRIKFLFVVPGIIWVLIFTIFPLLYSLRLSFMQARMGTPQRFIGLENYRRALFEDYRVWNSAAVTIFFVICSVLLTVLIGLGLALLFHRAIRGQRIFRAIFTMPMFTAPIALGYLGLTIFHEDVGAINTILRALGLPLPHWFSQIWPARFAIVLVDTWQWTPFCFLVLLAGLQALPDEIYEAAALDSSSSWDIFRWVTLPLLAPVLFTVTILRTVEAFKVLDIPFSMTSGGPGAATQTYSFLIYLNGLRNFNQGYASAMAYLLLVVMVLIASFFFSRMRASYE